MPCRILFLERALAFQAFSDRLAILTGGSRLPAEVVSAHPGLFLRGRILHGLGNRDDRAAVGGSPSGWTKNAR
jgi:hypothetical protein